MTESDYIIATNVARLQIAAAVLHQVNPQGVEEKAVLDDVSQKVAGLLQRYYYKAEHGGGNGSP